jgi:hypothetical protein
VRKVYTASFEKTEKVVRMSLAMNYSLYPSPGATLIRTWDAREDDIVRAKEWLANRGDNNAYEGFLHGFLNVFRSVSYMDQERDIEGIKNRLISRVHQISLFLQYNEREEGALVATNSLESEFYSVGRRREITSICVDTAEGEVMLTGQFSPTRLCNF